MRNFVMVGTAALLFALGVAQALAWGQSGPPGPSIYSPEWQAGDTSATNGKAR